MAVTHYLVIETAVHEPLGVMSMLWALTIRRVAGLASAFVTTSRNSGSVVSGGEALVALCLRGVAAHIDKSVGGADAEFGIALLRDPIAYVGDAVAGVD